MSRAPIAIQAVTLRALFGPVCSDAVTQEDRPARVTPTTTPIAPWRGQEVSALSNHRLAVRFVDGLAGTVDMSALIESPKAGLFARLRDQVLFAQVFVELGAVTWPGGLDLAPDAMHAAIKTNGEWRIVP